MVVTEAFARAMAERPRVCPQFHLALQSGSDAVLRRMKRCYNTEQFRQAAERIRAAWPMAAFTTDVIVGFPGETEEEFAETIAFCQEIGFAKLHVFPFSPREGTPAAVMEGQVPEAVKAERVRRLIAVGDELARQYRELFVGKVVPVLLEDHAPDGSMTGYTPEYIHVLADGGESGQLVKVRLEALTEEGMRGTIVE